ncbi:MAG: hypothetical protein AAFY35_14755 [Pseudomonadota bacterium]
MASLAARRREIVPLDFLDAGVVVGWNPTLRSVAWVGFGRGGRGDRRSYRKRVV